MRNAAVVEELRGYAFLPEEIVLIEKYDDFVKVLLRKDSGGNKHFFVLIEGNNQDVFKAMMIDLLTKIERYRPTRWPCYWVRTGGRRNNPLQRIYAAASFCRHPGSFHFFIDPDDFKAISLSYGEVVGRYHIE